MRSDIVARLQTTQSQAQHEQALYSGWWVMGEAAEEIARLRGRLCAGCRKKWPLVRVTGEILHQIETVGYYESCTAIEAVKGENETTAEQLGEKGV